MRIIAFLISVLVLTGFGQTSDDKWKRLLCTGRAVSGRYANYAEGFSVAMPTGLKGRIVPVDGPQRGVSVPLSQDCAGVLTVDGEPNSLEWATPADAITDQVELWIKRDPQAKVEKYSTRLGKLKAVGTAIHHRTTNDVEEAVIAFRPGGGPVYTALLRTTKARYRRDRERFQEVLRSFRLEPRRVVPP